MTFNGVVWSPLNDPAFAGGGGTNPAATSFNATGGFYGPAHDSAVAGAMTVGGINATGVRVGKAAGSLGFYGVAGVAKQTGVAVTAAAIHAALVALNLFTA